MQTSAGTKQPSVPADERSLYNAMGVVNVLLHEMALSNVPPVHYAEWMRRELDKAEATSPTNKARIDKVRYWLDRANYRAALNETESYLDRYL